MAERATHRTQPLVRTRPVMGTTASIHVFDAPATGAAHATDAAVAAAMDEVVGELDRLEAVFSTFRRDSQISRINAGDLHLLDADAEVLDVLDACTWLEHASGGAFRARRPDPPFALDPAGFVKGWATERAAQRLTDRGLRHWYVSVGGDVIAHGTPAMGRPWRVALADPRASRQVVGVIEIDAGAVATSGTAERGAHIWDGRTDTPADVLASLTVTGPSLAWADALATAAFALGAYGMTWLERFDDYAGIAVHGDGTITTTGAVAPAPPVLVA
ncbi:MAG: FAD:protein FMN transferase [Acidimicrobiales bacterium]|nr:FAD:protein FMN transferase [Acidimicrobiales bacterium]